MTKRRHWQESDFTEDQLILTARCGGKRVLGVINEGTANYPVIIFGSGPPRTADGRDAGALVLSGATLVASRAKLPERESRFVRYPVAGPFDGIFRCPVHPDGHKIDGERLREVLDGTVSASKGIYVDVSNLV